MPAGLGFLFVCLFCLIMAFAVYICRSQAEARWLWHSACETLRAFDTWYGFDSWCTRTGCLQRLLRSPVSEPLNCIEIRPRSYTIMELLHGWSQPADPTHTCLNRDMSFCRDGLYRGLFAFHVRSPPSSLQSQERDELSYPADRCHGSARSVSAS